MDEPVKRSRGRPKSNKPPVFKKKRAPNKNHPLPVGRPEKFDLKKEAKDLVEWANRPDATSLYLFTDEKEYLAQELTDFASRDPEFALALKKAKEKIAIRREAHCNANTMNYGVWAKNCNVYDKIVEAYEDAKEEKAFQRTLDKIKYEQEQKVAADQNKGIPPNEAIIIDLLEAVKKLGDNKRGSKPKADK